MANWSKGSADNLDHCDSCLMQIKSLDESFSLIGNWLFTREDLPENKNIDLDTAQWKLTKAPGSWANVYKDHKPSRIGWYRGVFEFDPSLIGQEVVFLLDAYMGKITFYLDEVEIYKRPNNKNIEKYYSIQPIPITFKVTKLKHVVAFRVDSPLMTGVYQLPFKLKKFDSRDISIAWYQFGGGKLGL